MPKTAEAMRRQTRLTSQVPGTCRMRSRFPAPAATVMAAHGPDGTLAHYVCRVEPWSPQRGKRVEVHPKARAFGTAQTLRLCTATAAAATLLGCSLPNPRTGQALRVEPVLRMDRGAWTADGAYAAGRLALSEGRTSEALMLFERAGLMRPRWDDPVNGQVVALARLGRMDDAIERASAAIAGGSSAAELHGNLGLMLLRSGRADEAWVNLEQAARLDPGNNTWSLALGRRPAQATATLARAKVAIADSHGDGVARTVPLAKAAESSLTTLPALEGARESLALSPAPGTAIDLTSPGAAAASNKQTAKLTSIEPAGVVSARRPEQPATVASAAAQGTVASPERATPRASTVATVSPQLRWARGPANVLSLQTDAPPPVVTRAAAPEKSRPVLLVNASNAPLSLRYYMIEISNGAGTPGLAKGTANALRTANITPWRITNNSDYKVTQTQIHYRGASDVGAAQKLANMMSVPVELVQNSKLHAGVTLRLLLGKDVAALPADKRLLAGGPQQLELFKT